MPASCPFCGAALNLGVKFCVVCGRHTSTANMTRMGGLGSGMRQGDLTQRLDEVASAEKFKRAKQTYRFRKHFRLFSLNIFHVLIALALLFCAVRFVIEGIFPGRVHRIIAPLFGKQAQIIEQTLTGKSQFQKGKGLRKHNKGGKLRRN
jgi:hypothetical protein